MRKLSLLIALALIVTISGVYAAWNYSQGATAANEITREINMAQVVTSGNKGTISAAPTNVAFLVDNGGEYKTVLKGTGHFDITFAPNQGADESVTASGIKMIATITVGVKSGATNLTYNGVVPITEKEENEIDLTPNGPSLTAKLEVTDILECIELADVVLDTHAKNVAYHSILANYTIVITVSEVPAI